MTHFFGAEGERGNLEKFTRCRAIFEETRVSSSQNCGLYHRHIFGRVWKWRAVPGGTMEVLTRTIACPEGLPPADAIFAYCGCPQPVPA